MMALSGPRQEGKPAVPVTNGPSSEIDAAALPVTAADAAVALQTRRPRPPAREERHEFRYFVSINVARLLSWLIWALPPRLRYWLAARGGDLYYVLFKTYRRNVLENLRQVVGPAVSDEELQRIARRVFRASGRNFADVLTGPHVSPEAFVRSMPLDRGDWSYIDKPLAEGKGLVLITAHLGAFDYLGHVMKSRGYKVTTVAARTTARLVFDAVTYLRGRNGPTIEEITPSGIRHVIRALRRGEIAAIVSDRDIFQNGSPVTFFGRETTLPPGAVRIARQAGAPIVAIFARRTETGYSLELDEPFIVEKTDDIDADIAVGLCRVVAVLERAIAASPDQWVMFQRVWPLEPASPVRVFPIGSPLESDFLERVGAAIAEHRPRRSGQDDSDLDEPPRDRTDPPRQSRA
jgi:KDO2-lipid IV(A) lauroyltransferase